ncbi:60S ribosomal protein L22 [Cichlidogyrus casuarinus]|uniref:Large ribosomal subunit protein eL22 n=1 Tax=Cichlidogyrus casuarinus TaxID=1844966 RepID=A0ABD2QP87_9PLAT
MPSIAAKHIKKPLKGKGPTKKKQILRYQIDCSPNVIDEDIVDMPSFEKYLKARIKVNGKTGNMGRQVHVERHKTSMVVTASIPFSKRYLKYLTKKFLKRSKLRDYLRVVAHQKDSYEIRFFTIDTEESDAEENN